MMYYLVEDLIRTERYIVTNIPIKWPELAEYLQKTCEKRGLRVPDINRRLLQLDKVETLYFWRYRSGGFVLPEWDGKTPDGKMLTEKELLEQTEDYFMQIGQELAYSKPVSYYISEVHRYYNAKRFQRISVMAEIYLTHHRHLHDEVYFDTQFPRQVAVLVRELTEEWHRLRNDYNRVIGVVKMRPRIRMKSFYDLPSPSSVPFATRNIYIEEDGVAGCYESTGALGAIERTTDVEEKKKAKGIPLPIFLIGILVLVIAFTIGIFQLPNLLAKKMTIDLENTPISIDKPDMSENKQMQTQSIGARLKPSSSRPPEQQEKTSPIFIYNPSYSYNRMSNGQKTISLIVQGMSAVYYVGDSTPYGRLEVASSDGALFRNMKGEYIVTPLNWSEIESMMPAPQETAQREQGANAFGLNL
jgi:hypothetical protein